jgi:hypothetical protein
MRPSLYGPGVVSPELESCSSRNKGLRNKIQLDLNFLIINQVRQLDRVPRQSDRQPQAASGQSKSVINTY